MKYLKYTLFLLYFVILANFVFAQDTGNKTVSGIYYNVSLKKVIQNLEKETSYSFTYLDTLISGKNITVSFLNKPWGLFYQQPDSFLHPKNQKLHHRHLEEIMKRIKKGIN